MGILPIPGTLAIFVISWIKPSITISGCVEAFPPNEPTPLTFKLATLVGSPPGSLTISPASFPFKFWIMVADATFLNSSPFTVAKAPVNSLTFFLPYPVITSCSSSPISSSKTTFSCCIPLTANSWVLKPTILNTSTSESSTLML
ncbi:hypothetical protein D3C86_1446970 [compost metagenome]